MKGMNATTIRRGITGALVLALSLLAASCGEDELAAIEQTMQELDAAAARQDGETFVTLLAPESFDYYDQLLKRALNAEYRTIQTLSITEKHELLVMRNRCTRKELEPMDGRAWVVHAVNKGWYGGITLEDESVFDKRIEQRGSTAHLIITYDAFQRRGTGEGSGQRVTDTLTFIKIEDRWLADWRRPSVLLERLIKMADNRSDRTVNQILEGIESRISGKDVTWEIWEKPMK